MTTTMPQRTQAFLPILNEIAACTLCAAHLPHGPRPVVQASADARLLIVGQAPGRRVHESGIPWDDPSGDLLIYRTDGPSRRHVALVVGRGRMVEALGRGIPVRSTSIRGGWLGAVRPGTGQ